MLAGLIFQAIVNFLKTKIYIKIALTKLRPYRGRRTGVGQTLPQDAVSRKKL